MPAPSAPAAHPQSFSAEFSAHSHSLPPHHRASRCHRNTSTTAPAQHSLTLLPYRWLSLWPALKHRRSSLRSRQRPPVHVDGPLACLPFCPPTTPVRHQASAPAATAQLPHQPSQRQRGRARLRRRLPHRCHRRQHPQRVHVLSLASARPTRSRVRVPSTLAPAYARNCQLASTTAPARALMLTLSCECVSPWRVLATDSTT